MHRVRISGVIVDGKMPVEKALMQIKGVGTRISNTITPTLGFSKDKRIGELNEKEISQIEEKLTNLKDNVPEWMVNRRCEPETGKDNHLIGPDLDMAGREDLNRMKKAKSYKGIRHQLNLPVRGQRTKSSFRRGSTVGVSRRKNK